MSADLPKEVADICDWFEQKIVWILRQMEVPVVPPPDMLLPPNIEDIDPERYVHTFPYLGNYYIYFMNAGLIINCRGDNFMYIGKPTRLAERGCIERKYDVCLLDIFAGRSARTILESIFTINNSEVYLNAGMVEYWNAYGRNLQHIRHNAAIYPGEVPLFAGIAADYEERDKKIYYDDGLIME